MRIVAYPAAAVKHFFAQSRAPPISLEFPAAGAYLLASQPRPFTVPHRKNPEDLTDEEIDAVFAVCMDSRLQDKLMDSNPEMSWMLAYVYDSALLRRLEQTWDARNQRRELAEHTGGTEAGPADSPTPRL